MNEKQAILLIHGIGEQKPMETLRRFVDTVWTSDKSVQNQHAKDPAQAWSKPDRLSRSFELRRLTTPENRNQIRTDFFEFYWAHLMHDTKLPHVLSWFRVLLWRNPFKLPRGLRSIYCLLFLGVLAAAFFAVNAAISIIEIPAWLSGAASLAIVPVLGSILKRIVGDAARYLNPAPTNIQRRHEIRSAGVALLRQLHRRNYARIVIVGHSLGSVIGYDVLTHAWTDFHGKHGEPPHPATSCLEYLEELARMAETDQELEDVEGYARAQRRYLGELNANGNPWRVTDFITLGSPLAHAEVLMARSAKDLKLKVANREFPSCPPVLEDETTNGVTTRRFTFPASYMVAGKNIEMRSPHHAAVFAPTRWVNLYFPAHRIVFGDFIAGPLRPVFGPGIRDIPVSTNQRLGLFTHTLYWTRPNDNSEASHINALRQALDIADDRGNLPGPMLI